MELSDAELHQWATKLVDTHQETLLESPTEANIQFELCSEDEEDVQKKIDIVKKSIDGDRVEIQMSRCTGEWQPETNLVKIIHQTGTRIGSLGCQNVAGKFLSPFEALFLLEINRLEIFEEEIPWTVSKAYRKLLPTNQDVVKYQSYRTFALDGANLKSVVTDEESCSKNKKLKTGFLHTVTDTSERLDLSSVETFGDIFKELQSCGPQAKKVIAQKEIHCTSVELSSKLLQGETNLLCYTSDENSIIHVQQVQTSDLTPCDDS